MDDELLNILSNSNKDIDNQKLMDYLSDKLSKEEKYKFEESMAGSEMLNDVVEGLEKFKNKKDVLALAEQLNANLKTQLNKKKERKLKREIKNINGLYFSIILIIIIILIGFFIIKKYLENEQGPAKVPAQKESISTKK